MDLYDCTLGVMRVGPYHYQPLRGVDLWLQQVKNSFNLPIQKSLYGNKFMEKIT
jgi:hypothetical protein